MNVFAQEIPTPEQMILLLKASGERYKTFDAKIEVQGYKPTSDLNNREMVYEKEVVWRSSGYKSYIKVDSKDRTANKNLIRTVKTYSISSRWSKELVESEGRTPRGRVEPGRLLEDKIYVFTVKDAICDFFTWPLEEADIAASSVVFDKVDNRYILTLKMGTPAKGPSVKVFIDSTKGWVPIRKQLIKNDGTVVMSFECSDYRLDKEGCWIPFKYKWIDPRDNFTMAFAVQEIKLNEPVSDVLFDVSFPDGTIVQDNIAGLHYIVKA